MDKFDALAKAREAAQQGKKPAQLNPVRKAIEKPTRGNAIKAMCAHCMGCTDDFLAENFRAEIRDCSAPKCPLHPFRPYQRKQESAA